MLSEVLTRKRMMRMKSARNWKEAINFASTPLIDDSSIKAQYVNEMIDSIEKFGPYVVVDDYIAIPHAISKNNVIKESMSLLFLEEAVDFKGKDVKLIIVLAPVDRTKHLMDLSELSELLMDEKNKKIFLSGNLDAINLLIKEG